MAWPEPGITTSCACGIWAARIHVWRGDLPRAARLVETFLPRARRHAVIQQLGPALVVAGLVETASGRPGAGADYATEFCELTDDTRAYRHMEIADVVRLLVAASRPEDAQVASANDVILTIRNQCHSLTAEAVLAAAAEAPDAADRFDAAAERWRTYGHPLETELAVVAAAALREGGPARGVDVPPGVSAASVAALCPVPGVATSSRPIRNQLARPSS